MDSVFSWISDYGYGALFALLMLGIIGLPVPDETLLMFSGYLVSQAKLQFLATLGTAFLGSACGISLSYFLGWWIGPPIILRCEQVFPLNPGALDRVRIWYQKKGKYALFFGYYIPGIRHLTALLAGSAKVPLSTFGLFAYSGGFVWSLTFISLGYGLEEEWKTFSGTIHQSLFAATILTITAIGIWLALKKKLSHR
jgi:membrane protein DedA with SNARE-associated domain